MLSTKLIPVAQWFLRRIPRGKHRLLPAVESLFPLEEVVSARLGNGRVMRVRARDVMHRQFFWLGEYEPETTAAFRSLLGPGMVVLDIGANIGYFTLVASDAVGGAGRVVAFEPVEENWRLLDENIRINGLANVDVERVALADTEATERMFLYRKDVNSGMGSLMGSESTTNAEQRSVSTATVDAFVRRSGLERVDVLKMDIQGGEGRALDGMRETLARGAGPVLIWEVNPSVLAEHGDSARRLLELLEGLGYRSHLIGRRCYVPLVARAAGALPDGSMLVSSRAAVTPPKGWRVSAAGA